MRSMINLILSIVLFLIRNVTEKPWSILITQFASVYFLKMNHNRGKFQWTGKLRGWPKYYFFSFLVLFTFYLTMLDLSAEWQAEVFDSEWNWTCSCLIKRTLSNILGSAPSLNVCLIFWNIRIPKSKKKMST